MSGKAARKREMPSNQPGEEPRAALPAAFLVRMEKLLGEEYGAFLESFAGERTQGLRLNPLRGLGEAVPDVFAEMKARLTVLFGLRKIPWATDGYYYGAAARPGRHPYHEAGLYYIQEPSAMAAVELLAPRPGERVLDLCAAPGGKTTQIAGRMMGAGLLVSNEIHPARAKILSQNVERFGTGNVVVTNEEPERLAERFPEFFDRILVDAPCSGEGMFRKDEEARREWSLERVRLCAARQAAILDQAAQMLRPGGRMVYSTCTFAPEEDEGSIQGFLDAHAEFHVEKMDARGCFSAGRPEWVRGGREELRDTFRIWPHRADGEGHYIAVLKKDGTAAGSACGPENAAAAKRADAFGKGTAVKRAAAAENKAGGVGHEIISIWNRFCRETFVAGDPLAGQGRAPGACPVTGSGCGSVPCLTAESGHGQGSCPDTGSERAPGTCPMTGSGRTPVSSPAAGPRVPAEDISARLAMYGDQLYLLPGGISGLERTGAGKGRETLSLHGLKVLRPGLHLGTVRRGRFEPSHALALYVRPGQAARRYDMPANGPEIDRYLRGETLTVPRALSGGTPRADGSEESLGDKDNADRLSDGWTLISVDGFSVGWAKRVGAVLKNHYPKGLRREF